MKFEDTNANGAEVSKAAAVAEVYSIKGEIMASGAVDSENSTLDSIINDVKVGNIKPEEGVKKAREIRDSRQNYH
jgi:hypothetical protein